MNAWFLGMFHRCSASFRVTTMIRIHQSAHFATPNRKRPLSLCKLASGYHLDLNLTTVVHSCCLLCATLWVWLLHFAHPANHVGHCLRIHPNTGFLQIFLQTILGHQGHPSFFGGCFLGGGKCVNQKTLLWDHLPLSSWTIGVAYLSFRINKASNNPKEP